MKALQRRTRVKSRAITTEEFLPAFVLKVEHCEIEFITIRFKRLICPAGQIRS